MGENRLVARNSNRRMKRASVFLFSALLVVLGLVATQPALAQAAGCSAHWHFIKASQLGRNVEPDASGYLNAGGGSDFWDQEFLFCPTGANQYEVYANLGGAYWDSFPYPFIRAEELVGDDDNKYVVTKYDAKFWTIWSVGLQAYVYTDANTGYLRDDRGSFLGGDNLFEISPTNLLG